MEDLQSLRMLDDNFFWISYSMGHKESATYNVHMPVDDNWERGLSLINNEIQGADQSWLMHEACASNATSYIVCPCVSYLGLWPKLDHTLGWPKLKYGMWLINTWSLHDKYLSLHPWYVKCWWYDETSTVLYMYIYKVSLVAVSHFRHCIYVHCRPQSAWSPS